MRMKPTKWKNQFGEGKIGDKPYSKYGKKLLGGTAGLTHTAKKIVDLFPDMKNYDYFVEPFAGKVADFKFKVPPVTIPFTCLPWKSPEKFSKESSSPYLPF